MRNFGHNLLVCTSLLIVFASTSFPQEPSWSDAARDLARRAVVAVGPGQVARLAVRNTSSLPSDAAELARSAFENELRSHGIRLLDSAQASASIELTFSENPREYVWVAQVFRGQEQEVILISIARKAAAAPGPSVPRLLLQPRLIWSQAEPFLDFAILEGAAGGTNYLLVLEISRLALYQENSTGWQISDVWPLEPPHPWPRDPRGRIILSGALLSLYLPGVECSGMVRTERESRRLKLACEKSEGWWEWSAPDGSRTGGILVAGRNYFRSLSWFQPNAETKVPTFYSVASALHDGRTAWIYASTDGVARMYSPEHRLLGTFSDWGSQLAAVTSPCTDAGPVLASSPVDWKATDTVRAFEIRQGQAAAASRPVEFAGPVMNLKPAEAGDHVLAVVRNLSTGSYEAYTISLSCLR